MFSAICFACFAVTVNQVCGQSNAFVDSNVISIESRALPYPEIVQPGGQPTPQDPKWLAALDVLRGKAALSAEDQQLILNNSIAGVDYPILSAIPAPINFACAKVSQSGYYADTDFQCQVFHYCALDGTLYDFLCPNLTITLVCDWFFNIDCPVSVQFVDYSNARLYHSDWPLLDDDNGNSSSGVTPASTAGTTATSPATTAAATTAPVTATAAPVTVSPATAAPATTTPRTTRRRGGGGGGGNGNGGGGGGGAGGQGGGTVIFNGGVSNSSIVINNRRQFTNATTTPRTG